MHDNYELRFIKSLHHIVGEVTCNTYIQQKDLYLDDIVCPKNQ